MAGDLSAKKRWKWLRAGGRNSAKPKTHDGSPQHAEVAPSADSSQANAVLSPEHAALSITAAPPALRPTADAAIPLPLAAPPAPPDVVLHTSLDNIGGETAELSRAVAGDRAVNTEEHSVRAGSLEHRANNTLRMLEPGLHVIFDSAHDGQPPSVAEIDVVAVHGLNFKDDPNHAQETWTKGDKLWLKDFLPAYLPKPARVMLFAYNSSPAFGASAIRLDDHARNLLQWLSLERSDVPQRPIMFICHSLGGLVVKQALVEAKLDESYKSILEATCLLVFFATPHRGGNYASVGDVAAKLFTKALRTGPNDLTNALKRNSDEATKRFEQARHLFERTFVVSFFEGRRYHKADVLVDKNSGTLNLPGSVEKQVAVDADHSAICKFDSNDSPACQLVLKSIAAEVKRGLELAQENRGPDPLSFSERDNKCMEDLQVTDPREDKIRIERDKGGLLRDSYHWVLNHVDFQRWYDDGDGQLLWIRGDPGKGKTMLLCGIIDELKTTAPTANISFFFCQAPDARINNATAVLRGLIYMLVTQQPTLISHLRKSYDGFGKQRFEGPNAWVALSKIFTSILEDLEDARSRRTYLIIDALDECIGDPDRLLGLVAQKSSEYSSVKWIVSSRNWPSIKKDLDDATQKVTLHLELNEASASAAVTTYVRFKVEVLAKRNEYSIDTRDAVERYLSVNAHGTFLWVALVCQQLANTSEWEAKELLTTFPPGLDAVYRRMMDQIHNSRHAELLQRMLAVISAVYRPITFDELPALVDIPDRASGNDKALAEIVRLCGSFLTIRDRSISFVHQSAKDFLLNQAPDKIFPSGMEDIHHTIFSRSLRVMRGTLRRDIYSLGHPGFPIDKVRTPNPDPLAAVRYSCVYWINHLRDCDPKTNENKDLQDAGLIDTFLREKYLHWLEALSLQKSISKGVASMLGLESLFETGKETSLLIDRVRDACRFILYHKWAIENSPLQVYASALVFSPVRSITRNQFEKEEPRWIIQKPTMADSWSACLQTLEGHSGSVRSVAWSHDATRLASASADKTIKIWDPATGQCVSTLEGHSGQVISVAWSHDATRLASASDHDDTVKIWDPATGQCISTLECCGHSVSVAWSHDATWLSLASHDNTLRIWDSATDQCLLLTLEGHSSWVYSTAWSRDASWLASASIDGVVDIWDAATGQCISTIYSGLVNSVVWSHDATRLASASVDDDTVKIWDPATSQCISTLHSGSVSSIAWSHDASQLASASNDKTIKIWDLVTGQCVSTLEDHSSSVWSVAWSHDATRLASASGDNTVKIWDPATGQCVSTLEDHSSSVWSVAWSHDATWLASASFDHTVKIWDPVTGHCVWTLDGHSNTVWSVAWSHDATRLASASDDKTIKIWDPATGQCVSTLETGGAVRDLQFHESNPDLLHTEFGTFDLVTFAIPAVFGPAVFGSAFIDRSPPTAVGYGLSSNRAWVTYQGENLLRLPSEYRPSSSAISGTVVAIGCSSGRILLFTFANSNPIS